MSDSSNNAIATYRLSRRFGHRWAVSDLDLRVPQGCVYGFLGLNGAGKSTTIRMLMGLLQPTSGSSAVLHLDPEEDSVELKRRVGYVPDLPSFYEWMSVSEMLAFVAHYRKNEWDDARAAHLLNVFQLPSSEKLGALSKGMRSKVSLTMALAFNPDLLILDEPTGGLDPVARRQFIEGVLAEFMDGERTIFISSHLINEISGLVDYVGILHNGKLIRSETTEELLRGIKRVKLTYDGEAPRAFACEGLVRSRTDGREAHLILDRVDPDRAAHDVKQLGAKQVLIEDLSLEEAFVEIVGGGGNQ